MITLTYIRHFIELHDTIVYALIVIGVIIEGEIIVILAGVFANLGSINIYFAFIATVFGGGVRSVLGYSFGYYLQTHHSGRPLLRYIEKRMHYFLPRFKERPFWSVFLSRFLVLGMHWFSVLFAGYKKVKLKVFAEAELGSLLIWSVLMLAVGYFFSFTALSVSRDVRKFILIIFAFFLAFFILEKIVAFIIELVSAKQEPKHIDKP